MITYKTLISCAGWWYARVMFCCGGWNQNVDGSSRSDSNPVKGWVYGEMIVPPDWWIRQNNIPLYSWWWRSLTGFVRRRGWWPDDVVVKIVKEPEWICTLYIAPTMLTTLATTTEILSFLWIKWGFCSFLSNKILIYVHVPALLSFA